MSDAFSGLTRAVRIEFLLSPWNGEYALEPFGFTSDELLEGDTVFLWEALADGRPVQDDGIFRQAREQFERKLDALELERTAHGWRELLVRGQLVSRASARSETQISCPAQEHIQPAKTGKQDS